MTDDPLPNLEIYMDTLRVCYNAGMGKHDLTVISITTKLCQYKNIVIQPYLVLRQKLNRFGTKGGSTIYVHSLTKGRSYFLHFVNLYRYKYRE